MKNINHLTDIFTNNNCVKPYQDVINTSFLLPQTKKEYLSIFRLYEEYIIDKNRKEIILANNENREPKILNLYSPDNAWEFIMNNNKLNNSTKKQRLKKFLSIMRKATNDASLIYSGNFPKNIKPKLKHIISEKELISYTNFLKTKGLYETLLIVELLYKFGFRVGAIAKVKVKNLSDDNNLVLIEKNSEIIKKNLLGKTADKIRNLIKIQKISDNDYIFFPTRFKNDENKRTKFLSYYIKKSMIESKAFPKNDLENISAHCFRATLAVKKYREGGALKAQKSLNHKNVSTTLSHYIKINDRGLELEEERQYKNNEILNTAFNYFNDSDKNDSENYSSNESNLSDDFSEDNLEDTNKNEEKDLFELNFSKFPLNNNNNKFLKRKRLLYKDKTGTDKNNIFEKTHKKYFESILQEPENSNLKEKNFIKNILMECGRIFTTKIESKKEQYQFSKYAKNLKKRNSLDDIDGKDLNSLFDKNEKGIYEFFDIQKKGKRYSLYAKKNIKKNIYLCEAVGKIILEKDLKSEKINKNDIYLQYIPFYKTKNKLRNRILITNEISNIIVFINIGNKNEKNVNTTFELYNDKNGLSHLILTSIKTIKKGELITISEEEVKI